MKYRAEIDGLRALAVLPVILFHAGFEKFSGGYVGVDVFFVISGYLITTIILSEKQQGRFSLVNFYDRRARRILPALFLVMLVTLPFAWMWLKPSDMLDFSSSLITVSTFVSNVLFWKETGYWGTANELKPLLHTWSLAVEEQYYVLFPLFLMVLWHFKNIKIFWIFIAIAVVSLITAQYGAYNWPEANFFLLFSRAWELAIGASIAFYLLYWQNHKPLITRIHASVIDEFMGLMGLLMIGYSVFMFDETYPFPGFWALIPTIGTGLIILFARSGTFTGKLLSMKLLVGIGLISYSAYLWHQPLLAFARHRTFGEPSDYVLGFLAAASLPLAWLSWRFVEKPFRTKGKLSRKSIFTFSILGSLFFILVGTLGHLTKGFQNRTTESGLTLQTIEKKLEPNFGLNETCTKHFSLSSECRTDEYPQILVWGDSYAMHLVEGVMASNPDAKVVQLTKSVCGPFFDLAPIRPKYGKDWSIECLLYSKKVKDFLASSQNIKYVVLSSPFERFISGNHELLSRTGERLNANSRLAYREFLKTLEYIKALGMTPVVFSPPPQNNSDIGACLAHSEWLGQNLDQCDFFADAISNRSARVFKFLNRIAQSHRVIRLDQLMCKNKLCKTHIESTFLYRDKGHLSVEGSKELGKISDFYKLITIDE